MGKGITDFLKVLGVNTSDNKAQEKGRSSDI